MSTDRPAERVTNGGERRWSPLKLAVWAAPALFMLLMWTATRFGDEVNWSGGDFVFAYVVLYGALGAYELVARMAGSASYRAGVGVAIATAVMLVWSVAAVGLTDTDADGLYLVVLAVGVVGALVARFRPGGMALAMLATALAMASVGVIALAAGMVAPHNSVFQILGISGFFVVLFGGSALLFLEAARAGTGRAAV